MRVDILKNGEVVLTKELGEGNFKIGRGPECDLQLKSNSVSKQHALLVIKGGRAAIVDLGSANGVFVNGILVKKQRVRSEDEIKIVDFSIRIGAKVSKEGTRTGFRAPRGNNPNYSTGAPGYDGNAALKMDFAQSEPSAMNTEPAAATTPQEKFLELMDQRILLPFFSLVKTFDWRWMLASILLIALLSSVLLSVLPVIRWGKTITTKEALARAHTIAAQVVRENYRILSKTNDNTRLTVEAAEAEKGVLSAYIVDPKTRTVLAPAKYFNKSLTEAFQTIAMNRVIEGKEDQVAVSQEDDIFIIAQPIRAYSPDTNENLLQAIVLVTFQITSEVTSTFQPMVEASLFAALFSLFAFFFIYKMFTHPISRIQEQLDAALKGDSIAITAEAKLPELESLVATINFSVSRLKQSGNMSTGDIASNDTSDEDGRVLQAAQIFDVCSSDAILLLDREKKVRYVGKALEEMLSMRNQYAQGQNISDACKDPGFAGTAIDMTERVLNSLGDAQSAMLDINGISRTMSAAGFKSGNGDIRFILLTVKMNSAS